MNEYQKYHPCSASQDSKAVVWKLQGKEVLWFTASCAVAILLFRVIYDALHFGFISSLTSAVMCPLLILTYLLRYVVGKPASYAKDWLEWKRLQMRAWLAEHGITKNAQALITQPKQHDE